MKSSKYSDSQILSILKQNESGISVAELCREHGMSSATFYKWRAKYGGMDVPLMKRMKELEDKNRRLKKMYAETPQSRNPTGGLRGKALKSSCRRQMASKAVLRSIQSVNGLPAKCFISAIRAIVT